MFIGIFVLLTAWFGFTLVRAGSVYYYYVSAEQSFSDVTVNITDENVVKYTGRSNTNGYEMFVFEAQGRGETSVEIYATTEEDPDGLICITETPLNLYVSSHNFIYTDSFGFSTFGVIAEYFCMLFLVDAAAFFILYKNRNRKQPYSHKAILSLGLCLFCLLSSAMSVYFVVTSSLNPQNYSSTSLFVYMNSAHSSLVLFSVPVVFVFAVFMSISNISLVRHEGYRVSNLLGFIISFLLGAGTVCCFLIGDYLYVGPGEKVSQALPSTAVVFVNSLFLYFECYLIATFYCMFKSIRMKPAYNADYIIILGCQIRKDGTLKPLLRGRVDKAIEFYKAQFKATGKKAVFVPSGGKGSDEIISEGEAMKNYLVSCGIEEEQIMPEMRSATTLENMRFSKELIESKKSNAEVVFSTTNYHVFRAGSFSEQAGLKATGLGAKTKWYFWPNALIRELVALIVSSYKLQIIILILLLLESFEVANTGLILRFLIK